MYHLISLPYRGKPAEDSRRHKMKTIKFGKTEFSTLSGEYVYLMDPVMGEKCLCFSADEFQQVLKMMASRVVERAAQEIEA